MEPQTPYMTQPPPSNGVFGDEPFTLNQMAPKKSRATLIGVLVGVFLILGLVAAGAGYAYSQGVFSDDPAVVDSNAGLVEACRTAVKARLKSPATAQFTSERATQPGEFYSVTGAVDSENAFGALLRNRFECTVSRSGDGWRVIDVTFAD